MQPGPRGRHPIRHDMQGGVQEGHAWLETTRPAWVGGVGVGDGRCSGGIFNPFYRDKTKECKKMFLKRNVVYT